MRATRADIDAGRGAYTRAAWDPVAAAAGVAERAIARQDAAAGGPEPADGDAALPRAVLADLHRTGLLAAPLPPALGGTGIGLDPGTFHPLLRTLADVGRADLSAGRLYEGHVDALLLVARFGTATQLARAARRVDRGGMFGVWNTGPADDGVRITPVPGGVRLDGRKTFASGAAHLAGAVVTGMLPDGGWQMCLVPVGALRRTGDMGIDRAGWRPLGMLGSASYAVDFRGARLPARALLGAPGDYYAQPRFTGGAARFAAVQLGGAERLLDAARGFIRDAGRGDDPYQLARVGEAATLVAGGRAWLRAAADVAEAHAADPATTDAATVVAHANMTRTAVHELCVRVCELVERSVGARGLLAPHPFARVVRDLLMYLRQPAPDAALADVGRHVLARRTRVGALWEPR
ncbi:hypothetical protein tb265_23450 [Gemmatimonadetes bacterium T265]|nr:hypothetical protein tb265_23450 [Gemmatimonadetes bacterium T265]